MKREAVIESLSLTAAKAVYERILRDNDTIKGLAPGSRALDDVLRLAAEKSVRAYQAMSDVAGRMLRDGR